MRTCLASFLIAACFVSSVRAQLVYGHDTAGKPRVVLVETGQRTKRENNIDTHGDETMREKVSGTPEYRAYCDAKSRCENTHHANYKYYGARGIKFRFSSFSEFIEDVGKRPSPRYSLDRKHNDKHYERGNIRWATKSTSNSNRRPHRKVFEKRMLVNMYLNESQHKMLKAIKGKTGLGISEQIRRGVDLYLETHEMST